ncbi:Hypothetical_protein [Hexamita inflata]|uniref:Hypothetical_protein n=1 Tax=Hexamita inflata TaxID=28002 RepID=A0ABP1GG86_9EUKA
MRLGQIGCGRQNPPVQSAELPSTSLQDWKAVTAPLLPQKRMVRRRWIRIFVPELLVALAAEVRLTYIDTLTYISVSKTNDHSRELKVPVQKNLSISVTVQHDF